MREGREVAANCVVSQGQSLCQQQREKKDYERGKESRLLTPLLAKGKVFTNNKERRKTMREGMEVPLTAWLGKGKVFTCNKERRKTMREGREVAAIP
jgi:hypothetical protein